MTLGEWLTLLGEFMLLSPLAIGGGITVAPGVHRLLVTKLALLTDQQFAASIAIAQIAPGPNVLYVAVAGYQAARLPGAAAALGGIMLPSSVLVLLLSRYAHARRDRRAMRAFKAGIAPLTIALLFATGWILVADAPAWPHTALALGSALVFWRTRVHILWLAAAGAIVGIVAT